MIDANVEGGFAEKALLLFSAKSNVGKSVVMTQVCATCNLMMQGVKKLCIQGEKCIHIDTDLNTTTCDNWSADDV